MGVTKKKSVAATNSRKNYKKNYKKNTGGELICKNFGVNGTLRQRKFLSDPTKIPPAPHHETCRTAFCVVSQTIAARPPPLPLKMAYCNPKTGFGRGASQKKLASQAYPAIGCVACNGIANHAIVEH